MPARLGIEGGETVADLGDPEQHALGYRSCGSSPSMIV
jgi:hypothetical protein